MARQLKRPQGLIWLGMMLVGVLLALAVNVTSLTQVIVQDRIYQGSTTALQMLAQSMAEKASQAAQGNPAALESLSKNSYSEFLAAPKLLEPLQSEAHGAVGVLQAQATTDEHSRLLQAEADELAKEYQSWLVVQDVSGSTAKLLALLALCLVMWIFYRYHRHHKQQLRQALHDSLAQQETVLQFQVEVEAASEQIIRELNEVNARQKKFIAEVKHELQNLVANVGKMAAMAKQVNHDWVTNLSTLQQNMQQVEDLVSCVMLTVTKLSEAGKFSASMQDSCRRLTAIPAVSKELAEEAKLLALNAAIQLAASDHGSSQLHVYVERLNFLADKIADAGSSIEQLLAETQVSVDGQLVAMTTAHQEVSQGCKIGQAVLDKLTVLDKSSMALAQQLKATSVLADKHMQATNSIDEMITNIENNATQSSVDVDETRQSLERLAGFVTILHKASDVGQAEAKVAEAQAKVNKVMDLQLKPFDLEYSLSAKEQ